MNPISKKIKTHKIGYTYSKPHFFILSKGNNSGKPLENPCPNCFVCICDDEAEKNQLYWLLYGLWQGTFFNPFIGGSVIPFIRINDLKKVILIALDKVVCNPSKFDNAVQVMRKLEEHSKLIVAQINLIKQAKKTLMYSLLK